MSRHEPMRDGWVCPSCGQSEARHGRGGARACRGPEPVGPRCEGLQCECEDGKCHEAVIGWTRSPCEHARCSHCGWTGSVRSKAFERKFGSSRCPVSENGSHDIAILPRKNAKPAMIFLGIRCKLCGATCACVLDPKTLPWVRPKKLPPKEA